jgi:flagellin-like protein
MKAISPMIATVLLIGFTIAVGAILSLWFTTFTRTQTATITGSAACHAGNVKIMTNATTTASSAIRVFVTNLRSDMNITINSITVVCNGSISSNASTMPLFILAGRTNSSDVSGLSGCTSANVRVDVMGICGTGGSFLATCPRGTCGVY